MNDIFEGNSVAIEPVQQCNLSPEEIAILRSEALKDFLRAHQKLQKKYDRKYKKLKRRQHTTIQKQFEQYTKAQNEKRSTHILHDEPVEHMRRKRDWTPVIRAVIPQVLDIAFAIFRRFFPPRQQRPLYLPDNRGRDTGV